MKIFTIGFTKKTAENFFTKLRNANALSGLVDVRLNNVSQLAGFAKRDDLAFFLRELCHLPYRHDLRLAPTQLMLDSYKKQKTEWATYESEFLRLLESREIESEIVPHSLDGVCLLCSEDKPHHCHRRLVAEYLQRQWGGIEIVHL